MEKAIREVSEAVDTYLEDTKRCMENFFSVIDTPFTVTLKDFYWCFNPAHISKTLVVRQEGVKGKDGIKLYVQPFKADEVFLYVNTEYKHWEYVPVTYSPNAFVANCLAHLLLHLLIDPA